MKKYPSHILGQKSGFLQGMIENFYDKRKQRRTVILSDVACYLTSGQLVPKLLVREK